MGAARHLKPNFAALLEAAAAHPVIRHDLFGAHVREELRSLHSEESAPSAEFMRELSLAIEHAGSRLRFDAALLDALVALRCELQAQGT